MNASDVLGLILGGGRGARLWPLTKLRAKPAVPIGGKYRLIDIPLSNCLNSGVNRVAVLTQFNSVSLHRHIAQTYHFDYFHTGWVQILAAEQTFYSADWYQGTADAVRKQLYEIQVTGAEHVLILSGDHLYRMDFSKLIAYHKKNKADLTVAVQPVSREDASRFGILKLHEDGRIQDFAEKPKESTVLDSFALPGKERLPFMGSMGIYCFRTGVLAELLDSSQDDFGGDIIPSAIPTHKVFGYTFNGYWEDIGTIRSYYNANLALVQNSPPFDFHHPTHPIYTRPRFLPGSRVNDVVLDRVLLSDGCILDGILIRNSMIGIRSVIAEGVSIMDTVMLGSDYYDNESRRQGQGLPPIGVGENCTIQGAIIDKNARIGPNVTIQPFPRGTEHEEETFAISDGIVVVPKHAVLNEGTIISPETMDFPVG
ncbi:MAG: glucose-1-phosphate adenylyltransferase [Anaerolineales bacterium]|nr:glucose-1-phosphate adenylyltransferase [Anaerolineales bacterium]